MRGRRCTSGPAGWRIWADTRRRWISSTWSSASFGRFGNRRGRVLAGFPGGLSRFGRSGDPARRVPPRLAQALNNRSGSLAALGRREDALAAITEAVATYRRLAWRFAAPPGRVHAPTSPGAEQPVQRVGGAGSARGRAGRHHRGRRHRPGVGRGPPRRVPPRPRRALNQPVASTWRRWAGARTHWPPAPRPSPSTGERRRPGRVPPRPGPGAEQPVLRLAGLGRREEALAASTEAVAIRRELAAARPDAFTPDLAGSLNNHSNAWRSWAGARTRWPPAPRPLRSTGSCVMPPRPSSSRGVTPGGFSPPADAFRPDLAGSLNNQSNALAGAGPARGGAGRQHRGRRHRTGSWPAARPDAFTPDLAVVAEQPVDALAAAGPVRARRCSRLRKPSTCTGHWLAHGGPSLSPIVARLLVLQAHRHADLGELCKRRFC